MKKIDVVIGTRPEAIKMAPVITELSSRSEFRVRAISTGQHTDMLKQALSFFGLSADIDLQIMKERQSLDHITSSVLTATGRTFDEDTPDAVLVHGDTTTTLASSLAAFYRHIPVGHVEAGLRSNDMSRPFPEEMNRVVADKIATWHFAPTIRARDNLRIEGFMDDSIHVTGNTVIDALYWTAERAVRPSEQALARLADGRRFMLLTAHRRESWGEPMKAICRAALRVARAHSIYLLVPMHKNPAVRETIHDLLGDDRLVILCDPLGYADFVWALAHCELILSDSGGVQEEATSLAKPIVILRDVTERPEAVEQGSGILVGTDEERIFSASDDLLSDKDLYESVQLRCKAAPFGDGRASIRIAEILSRELKRG